MRATTRKKKVWLAFLHCLVRINGDWSTLVVVVSYLSDVVYTVGCKGSLSQFPSKQGHVPKGGVNGADAKVEGASFPDRVHVGFRFIELVGKAIVERDAQDKQEGLGRVEESLEGCPRPKGSLYRLFLPRPLLDPQTGRARCLVHIYLVRNTKEGPMNRTTKTIPPRRRRRRFHCRSGCSCIVIVLRGSNAHGCDLQYRAERKNKKQDVCQTYKRSRVVSKR